MKRVLFTKTFDNEFLQVYFGDSFQVEAYDFIEIEENPIDEIKAEIDDQVANAIVSSVRSARLIQDLPLSSSFYVVGEKSKEVLENAGLRVAHWTLYADDLVAYIQVNFKEKSSFNFFCSQIRRDTIPEALKAMGHKVNEIIAYKTRSKAVDIAPNYDAYVFYSPSGVKSFQEQYGNAEKARIFAIGKTTADAVEKHLGRKAEFPDRPDHKALIQFIKTRLNAEK